MQDDGINFKVNLSYNKDFIQDDDAGSQHLMFVFWGIITPIISTVGFFGNILTIIVLFRREMQSTTIYFLRTLVVTDTAIIIGAVLGLSVIAITMPDPEMWIFNDVIYPHIYTPTNYIVMALQMINVWVTVAVTVERYIAICHPFKSVKICTKRNAFISLAVIVVISTLYNIPRCFATTAAPCKSEHHTCFQLVTTAFGQTLFYTQVYFFWMYMILIYIIPLLVLSILNTLLIIELMRMRRRRIPSNVQENSETNMSMVLVLIVLVFIFCQTPGLCAQFQFWEPHVLIKWTCVSNTLFVFNSSVNFLIYTAVGRKFRKVLLKTFQVIIKKPVNEFTKASYSQNGTELKRLHKKPSDMSSDDIDEKSRLKDLDEKSRLKDAR